MYKPASVGGAWVILDGARTSYNTMGNYIYANASDSEAFYDHVDFYSNGWKFRRGDGQYNANGLVGIYIAFAESPFQYARAR